MPLGTSFGRRPPGTARTPFRLEESGHRRAKEEGLGDGGEDREGPMHGPPRDLHEAHERQVEETGDSNRRTGGLLQNSLLTQKPSDSPVTLSTGVLFGLSTGFLAFI